MCTKRSKPVHIPHEPLAALLASPSCVANETQEENLPVGTEVVVLRFSGEGSGSA